MNYSNLPVYIQKEDGLTHPPFANIYDPSGADNSLYFLNLNQEGTTSVQYLDSLFTRVSGNTENYEELFAPKTISQLSDGNQTTEVYLPKFRSLIFYNLNGTRAKDPLDPTQNIPPLYFIDYDSGTNVVKYVNYNYPTGNLYIGLKWSGSNDKYSLDYYSTFSFSGNPSNNLIYSSGTGFSSGWKLYATNTYTGIVCSGFGISADGIINAINDPNGTSLYTNGLTSSLAPNSSSNSSGLDKILYAKAVDYATGYVYPYSKLTLGKGYSYIPAQNISIDYSAQNDALRLLGVNIDKNDQFTNGGALQAKISFNSYINTETSGALINVLNSSGEDSYSIRFGNNIYDNCYLTNYDLSVEPFKPTMLNASYIINNAPKINENNQEYVSLVTPAATNYLLYSESLPQYVFGLNDYTYNYVNIDYVTGQLDLTGGNKATLITSTEKDITSVSYSTDNSQSYTYTSISDGGGGTFLSTLQTNEDESLAIGFTGDSRFTMGNTEHNRVYISNNGIITFINNVIAPYANPQNSDFPIFGTTRNFIAAYWQNMFASVGSIWYRQDSDRFIIEYNGVNATSTGQPQTFQIHLYFDTGIIEIRYKTVTTNFNPNPNVGIQWGLINSNTIPNGYINYGLSNVYLNKSLKFIPTITNTLTKGSVIYRDFIQPSETRTFSIYLKAKNNIASIAYTLDGGVNWLALDAPSLIQGWRRYEFPSNNSAQKIGILLEDLDDSVYIYGAQLENGSYATDYIPTLNQPVTRSGSTINIPVDIFSPTFDLTTGFANTMINGNNCSVSSTTGFISSVQSSIKYSVNCGRTPIYNIGNTNANNFILDTVEKQMDISSTDLVSFIDYTGSKLPSDLLLTLKNAQNITGSVISMKSGANIYSQQSNIQEGDTLVTQVSIKEIVV